MLPYFSYTFLSTNHQAELERHTRSARLHQIGSRDHERTPRTRHLLRHWTNR